MNSAIFLILCALLTTASAGLGKDTYWKHGIEVDLDPLYIGVPYRVINSDNTGCDTDGFQTSRAYRVIYQDDVTVKVCLAQNPVMPVTQIARKFGMVPKFIREVQTQYLQS